MFLAIKGSSARTLMPKLALAGLAGKPRVATSQLLSGTGKPEEDRVLDGIAFPSEVWTTRGVRGLPPAAMRRRTAVQRQGPGRAPVRVRLRRLADHRLPANAWPPSPTAASTAPPARCALDGFGNVLRTPAWSTFSAASRPRGCALTRCRAAS